MAKLASFKFESGEAKEKSSQKAGTKLPGKLVNGIWQVKGIVACTSKAGVPYYNLSLENGAVKEPTVYISQYTLYTLVTEENMVKDPKHLDIDVPDDMVVQITDGYYSKATGSAPVLSKHERFRKAKGGAYLMLTDTQLDGDATFQAFV